MKKTRVVLATCNCELTLNSDCHHALSFLDRNVLTRQNLATISHFQTTTVQNVKRHRTGHITRHPHCRFCKVLYFLFQEKEYWFKVDLDVTHKNKSLEVMLAKTIHHCLKLSCVS